MPGMDERTPPSRLITPIPISLARSHSKPSIIPYRNGRVLVIGTHGGNAAGVVAGAQEPRYLLVEYRSPGAVSANAPRMADGADSRKFQVFVPGIAALEKHLLIGIERHDRLDLRHSRPRV